MQKGRPPRNPVEKLRIKVLMRAVRMNNSSLRNGYQLEKHFEPHLIQYDKSEGVTRRSCKWDRYLQGTTPSKETLGLIKKRYPKAYDYFDSALWVALKAGKQTEQYWAAFYFLVNDNLKTLCYRFKATKNASFYNIGKVKQQVIDCLVRQGTLDDVACLFALLRESSNKRDITEHDALETAIFNSIFWTLGSPPFSETCIELLDYLKAFVLRVGIDDHPFLRPSPWELSPTEVGQRIWIDHKNITMAEDIGLLISHTEIQEFMYWKLKGNSQLIVREMADAYSVQCFELPNSEKGLKWLIGKLNSGRSKSKKQNLEYL